MGINVRCALILSSLVIGLNLPGLAHAQDDGSSYHVQDKQAKSTPGTTTGKDDGAESAADVQDNGDRFYAKRYVRPEEKVISESFGTTAQVGTAGCKSETLAKDVIAGLKSDCGAWVNDRKTELKEKFVTSSCQERCDDCGMTLRRCSVTGTVRYIIR